MLVGKGGSCKHLSRVTLGPGILFIQQILTACHPGASHVLNTKGTSVLSQYDRNLCHVDLTFKLWRWVRNKINKITVFPFTALVYSGHQNKYHRLNSLNNKNEFSHSSRGQTSKIQVWQSLVAGEGSLPGFQMAAFPLCPHMASPQCMPRERINCFFSSKDTNPMGLRPHP